MIKRHDITNKARDWYSVADKEVEKSVDRLKQCLKYLEDNVGPSNQFIINELLILINILSLIKDHDRNLLYTGLVYYLDAGIGHFQQYFTKEKEIESRFGDKMIKLKSIDDDLVFKGLNWINLLSATLILKDKKRTKELLELKDQIREFETDSFVQLFVDYLAGVITKDEDSDLRQKYIASMEEAAKSNVGIYHMLGGVKKEVTVPNRSKFLSTILLPTVKLYELTLAKNEKGFNDLLSSTLAAKAKYYDKKGGVIENFIDLHTCGCCAFAYDQGVKISVEGEYIPRELWAKDWKGAKLLF